MLSGKKIVLGITGGIAAYKCPELVRLLIKQGAEVKVVMTKNAAEFVTVQTLAVLSRNEVKSDFFDNNHNWNNHVELAEWADLILIAPLTAATLSRMATGHCDNLLMAVYLSARSPVIVAPAMDLDMYRHPTTAANLKELARHGVKIIPAETGELASGLTGQGRMAEPETILSFISAHFSPNLPLSGKRVLINAGPTYEAIDPVRFIGNRSSGMMGIALADEFSRKGAEVTLVLGPTHLAPTEAITLRRVESAEQMYKACTELFAQCDIAVCAAAVSDYKPEKPAGTKLKKGTESFALPLVRTPDILQSLGEQKVGQCLVGFALETENLEEYAAQKLKKKNLDFIVANYAGEQTGFGAATNKVIIINRHNKISTFELKPKAEVAADIVQYTIAYLNEKTPPHS